MLKTSKLRLLGAAAVATLAAFTISTEALAWEKRNNNNAIGLGLAGLFLFGLFAASNGGDAYAEDDHHGYHTHGGYGHSHKHGHGPQQSAPKVQRVQVNGQHCVGGTDWLNVRSGPSVDYKRVAKLGRNQGVYVAQCVTHNYGKSTWCHVTNAYHEQGWVNARYLGSCQRRW